MVRFLGRLWPKMPAYQNSASCWRWDIGTWQKLRWKSSSLHSMFNTRINSSCNNVALRIDRRCESSRVTSESAKIQEKFQISFCKILNNKWYHAKVLRQRFFLNSHTIGFRPQTQKLKLHYNWLGRERFKAPCGHTSSFPPVALDLSQRLTWSLSIIHSLKLRNMRRESAGFTNCFTRLSSRKRD